MTCVICRKESKSLSSIPHGLSIAVKEKRSNKKRNVKSLRLIKANARVLLVDTEVLKLLVFWSFFNSKIFFNYVSEACIIQ